MTKQELISKQQAMTRYSNRWAVPFLVVFMGVLIANIPLAQFIDREKPATWFQVLYGVACFSFLLGNFPLIAWFVKREQRKFGLLCPGCSKPLVGISGKVTVATGACGLCGERILRD